jgi:DNA-binding MarR family transcriptional regulator
MINRPAPSALPNESPDDPLADMAQVLLAQSTFERAARHYIEHIVEWRRELGLYNRVGTEIGQHITYYIALLHFTQPPDRPTEGATYSNILAICERRGQCGPRALRTILQALRVMGLITMRRAEGDGRVQVYAPSERLTVALREHLKQTMRCLDLIFDEARYAPRIEAERPFASQILAKSGRPYIDLNLQIVEAVPDLEALITLRGGCPTMFRLLKSHIDGVPAPSPQLIAKEFKLSASQVRNVIQAAEISGLISRRQDGSLDVQRLFDRQCLMLARELALHAKYGLQIDVATEHSMQVMATS